MRCQCRFVRSLRKRNRTDNDSAGVRRVPCESFAPCLPRRHPRRGRRFCLIEHLQCGFDLHRSLPLSLRIMYRRPERSPQLPGSRRRSARRPTPAERRDRHSPSRTAPPSEREKTAERTGARRSPERALPRPLTTKYSCSHFSRQCSTTTPPGGRTTWIRALALPVWLPIGILTTAAA